MKKIPTVFERNWDGVKQVLNTVHPGCEWVLAGEGVATVKHDGSCCLVRDGKLYKRREAHRLGVEYPPGFLPVDNDPETGKVVGWVPVGDGPEDKYHREGLANAPVADGTYELVGPKVQGNPELRPHHMLERHGATLCNGDVPRTFDGLRDYLAARDMEGIVFHHPDGRMAKIKLRDFGLKRGAPRNV